MPKAVVIELIFNTPLNDWQIVTNNSHGNTVRSTFLAFAESGWTCDVRLANYSNQNYGAYDYVSKLASTPYDLVICSWRLNEYFLPSFEAISAPVFIVSETRTPYISGTKIYSPIIFVGADENFKSRRIDTWDIATNLSGSNQNAPSYANAVVAGKCTKLLLEGFNTNQIKNAVQEQAISFPEWTEFLGYGKAPSVYNTVLPEPLPEPEPPIDPPPEPIPPYIPTLEPLFPKTFIIFL